MVVIAQKYFRSPTEVASQDYSAWERKWRDRSSSVYERKWRAKSTSVYERKYRAKSSSVYQRKWRHMTISAHERRWRAKSNSAQQRKWGSNAARTDASPHDRERLLSLQRWRRRSSEFVKARGAAGRQRSAASCAWGRAWLSWWTAAWCPGSSGQKRAAGISGRRAPSPGRPCSLLAPPSSRRCRPPRWAWPGLIGAPRRRGTVRWGRRPSSTPLGERKNSTSTIFQRQMNDEIQTSNVNGNNEERTGRRQQR